MAEEKNQTITIGLVVKNLKDYVAFLFSYKKTIITIAVLGLILGIVYAKFSNIIYKSQISFIVNESKSVTPNILAALASQFGGQTSNVNVSDDRLLFLITTRRILGQALLTKTPYSNLTIADQYILINDLKSKWKSDTTLFDFDKIQNFELNKLTYKENKAIDFLIKHIIKSSNLQLEAVKKKTSSLVGQSSSGIILITFQSKDELLPKILVEAIYSNLNEFYTETITKSLKNNLDLVTQRADSTRRILENTEFNSANELDITNKLIKYKAKVNAIRLRKDAEMLSLMYAEIIKNKEIAKFNYDQEKPVFQVIDAPTYPLESISKSLLVCTFIGTFLGGFMVVMFFTFKFLVRKF